MKTILFSMIFALIMTFIVSMFYHQAFSMGYKLGEQTVTTPCFMVGDSCVPYRNYSQEYGNN